MFRSLVTAATLLAFGLAAVPAAAQSPYDRSAADQRRLGAIIAGTAGLLVLGKVLHDRQERRERRSERRSERRVAPPPVAVPAPAHTPPPVRRTHRRPADVGPQRPHGTRPCLRRRIVGGQWVTYRDQRCVDRRRGAAEIRRGADVLPRRCLRQRWDGRQWVTYRDRRCLGRVQRRDD